MMRTYADRVVKLLGDLTVGTTIVLMHAVFADLVEGRRPRRTASRLRDPRTGAVGHRRLDRII
jgi:hypothetical protein